MSQPENNPPALPPSIAIIEMATSYWVSQSLYVAAKLGIADLLADEPKAAAEIAKAIDADPDAIYRLLRALASVGVFIEIENRSFALTPIAACLQTGVPGSMRNWTIMLGEEHYRAWGNLLDSVKTGQPAFDRLYSTGWWDYCAQNPTALAAFDAAMIDVSQGFSEAIASAYDFSQASKLVDVAGGRGGLLFPILKANPGMNGILFDLPVVIDSVKQEKRLEMTGITERCDLVAGSFFESVPTGGDTYILKNIIHDWGDKEANGILQNCHRAMPDHGKLLLVELVIPSNNAPFIGKLLDLNMMVMLPGARERTVEEYRNLLQSAGFELTSIFPTPSPMSVIEAVKR